MNKSSLIKKSILSAGGVVVYVTLIAWLLNNASRFLGPRPGFMASAFVILLYLISACVTGALVLLHPARMYIDGKKAAAMYLLSYTIVALAIFTLAVLVILVRVR